MLAQPIEGPWNKESSPIRSNDSSSLPSHIPKAFGQAYVKFEGLLSTLSSEASGKMTEYELEELLQLEGKELLRRLLQGALDHAGSGDVGRELTSADGPTHERTRQRPRQIESAFGRVELKRQSYEAKGEKSLRPRDAQLNLPTGLHSHSVRKRIAYELAKSPYREAQESVQRSTAASISVQRAEELAQEVSRDFDAFYQQHQAKQQQDQPAELLVLSADGKGVVLRLEDLREPVRKAAEAAKGALDSLGGEPTKSNRKRRACVASVYEVARFVRRVEDIVPILAERDATLKRPKPQNKRLWASLEKEYADVVAEVFCEAARRDPDGERAWVALLDGDPYQIKLFRAQAQERGVELVLVLDIIHVLGYLYKAASALYGKGTDAAQQWVRVQLMVVLYGCAQQVVATLRTESLNLRGKAKEALTDAARYIENHLEMMDYRTYLAAGYPIASGVIEGGCGHLVCDRMELTGARWSLQGAEAILKLRALYVSGDFDDYWHFHMKRDFERNHAAKYADPEGILQQNTSSTPNLRLIKS